MFHAANIDLEMLVHFFSVDTFAFFVKYCLCRLSTKVSLGKCDKRIKWPEFDSKNSRIISNAIPDFYNLNTNNTRGLKNNNGVT